MSKAKWLVYYYCSRDDDLMAAHREDVLAAARIEAQAESFAKQFNAVPLYETGFSSRFAGVTFNKEHPCPDKDLWTPPTPSNPVMVPRSPERAGAAKRAAAEVLYQRWHDTWPKDAAEARPSSFMTYLGIPDDIDTSQLLMVYAESGGEAYIATNCVLPLPQEVTATAFLAAQAAASMAQSAGPAILNAAMEVAHGR